MVIISIQFHQSYLHKFLPYIRANQISQFHSYFKHHILKQEHIYIAIYSHQPHIPPTIQHHNSISQFKYRITSSTTYTSNIQSKAHIHCITRRHCSSNIITPQYTMRSNNHHINSSPTFIWTRITFMHIQIKHHKSIPHLFIQVSYILINNTYLHHSINHIFHHSKHIAQQEHKAQFP